MPHAFWEAIAETPWWVYLILFGLFSVGYRATQSRIISVKPLIIYGGFNIALLFIGYSIITRLNFSYLPLLLLCILPGFAFGWAQFYFSDIKAVRNKPQLYLPGSWIFLVLILMIVAAKYYYFGASYYIDIDVIRQDPMIKLLSGLLGFSLGLYLGRVYRIVRLLKVGPFCE